MQKEVILVVDDDPQITSFLARYLEKQEFRVLCAPDGVEMNKILSREKIDLCVLDISLPGKSGFDITRDIRATSNLPILVLSGRDEAFDRVVGLEIGADDYMVKPFEPRELLARIRTILRRCKADPTGAGSDKPQLYRFGAWLVNGNERSLARADSGAPRALTTSEFEILQAFVQNPNIVFSRGELLDIARRRENVAGGRTVDVHIARLRKKIEPDPQNPVFIKTIHGIGYSFIGSVTRPELPDRP